MTEPIEKAGLNYYERMAAFIKENFPNIYDMFHLSARGYAGGKGRAEALAAAAEMVEDAPVEKANPTPDDVHVDTAEMVKRKCAACGKMVVPVDGKCPECGASMEAKEEPTEKSDLVEIAKGDYAAIVKTDTAQHKLWSVVLEPHAVDTQGDWLEPAEIEKAAHKWMEAYQHSGIHHVGEAVPDIRPVESYIAPVDMVLGEQPVKQGSWVLAVHVNKPELWDKVEKGELNGFSVQGTGKRKKRLLKEAVEKAGAFFTDENGTVHPMGGKGVVPSAMWGKMTEEERKKAKEDAKGKEEKKDAVFPNGISESLADGVAKRMLDQVANKPNQGMSESFSDLSPGRLTFANAPSAARVKGDWGVITATELVRFPSREGAHAELVKRIGQTGITLRGNGRQKDDFLKILEQWAGGKNTQNIMADMYPDDF